MTLGRGGGVSTFVGRDDLHRLLDEELQATADGARIVSVEGETGIGKTSLVRHFLSTAAAGITVAWVTGSEDEAEFRFGVVGELGRKLTARPGGFSVQRLLAAAPETEPLAVGAELLGMIGEVDGTAAVVVDDLQWLDADSARALLFALRRLSSEPVLVVLIVRTDPVPVPHGWGHLVRDGLRTRRIMVPGLDVEELGALATAMCERPLDQATVARLHEHTRGHPMHARALLGELSTDELQARRGVLPAPRSLAATIAANVATLPEPARHLVSAAAVLGLSAPLPRVVAVARVADPAQALETAIDAGLLDRSVAGDVAFPHPLVRGAVYNSLPPTLRSSLHTAAAAETSGAAALDHRLAASAAADPGLAADMEAFAYAELRSGATLVAAERLFAAAPLWPDPADQERCRLLGVEAVFYGGDQGRARALRTMVEDCSEGPLRAYALACVEFATGRLAEAEALGATAIAGLVGDDGGLTDVGARAAAGLAVVRAFLGRWEDAVSTARLALAHDPDWTAGFARFALALSLGPLDRSSEPTDVVELVPAGDLDALVLSGMSKLWTDDLAGAVTDLLAVADRARAGFSPRLLILGLSCLTDAYFRLGQWDDALMYGELAVSIGRDADLFLGLQQAYAVTSYVHSGRGQFDTAEMHLNLADGLAAFAPTWTGTLVRSLGRVRLAEARDDAEGMRRALEPLVDGPVRDNLEGQPLWEWRVKLADAQLGTGDLEGARETLEALEALMARRGVVAPAVDAARLRGEIAAADGDAAAAGAAFESGLQPGTGLPLPTARLELSYGSLLRRQGNKRAAIGVLSQARQRLAALGAQPYVARCDEQLVACGLPSRPGSDGADGPLSLTPAERTVAHLVAQGMTNREVATRLYVSTKAIEFHLGNTYAKLGISSRRQLAARIDGAP